VKQPLKIFIHLGDWEHVQRKFLLFMSANYICRRGRRGRDLMIFGFTTTYAVSAYQH